ncbi:MAG: Asp-tRNA(Asn)/Glu-tRNA(Gln) amidotransferase GatCAB subunit C [Dehalococcoidia bacterium]|nr:Asp-tRNA(Asn)/Glu-tRNA(Gln) amidotransferase GatCAB subunit C [Dehalococcoidia bacterium]
MISREDVEHVAQLARLGLSDEEKERLAAELSRILEHFRSLQQLDTAHIPPTAQVIGGKNVMRGDEARPSLPLRDVLRNAPRRDGDYFRVQAVLEE